MTEKELMKQRIEVLKLKVKDLEHDIDKLHQNNGYLQEVVNNYYKLLERER